MVASDEAVSLHRELARQQHRLSCLEVVEQAEAIVRDSRERMLRELAGRARQEADAIRRELGRLMTGHDLFAIMAVEQRLCEAYRRVDAVSLLLRRHEDVCGVARSVYVAVRSQTLSAIAGLSRRIGDLETATIGPPPAEARRDAAPARSVSRWRPWRS